MFHAIRQDLIGCHALRPVVPLDPRAHRRARRSSSACKRSRASGRAARWPRKAAPSPRLLPQARRQPSSATTPPRGRCPTRSQSLREGSRRCHRQPSAQCRRASHAFLHSGVALFLRKSWSSPASGCRYRKVPFGSETRRAGLAASDMARAAYPCRDGGRTQRTRRAPATRGSRGCCVSVATETGTPPAPP